MAEYAHKAASSQRAPTAAARTAAGDSASLPEQQTGETELNTLQVALNQSPRTRAVAQLQRVLNQSRGVRARASLAAVLQKRSGAALATEQRLRSDEEPAARRMIPADGATAQRVRIGGVRYKTVAAIPGSTYELVRRPGTQQRLVHDTTAGAVLPGGMSAADGDQLVRVVGSFSRMGVANTDPMVLHAHAEITAGRNAALVLVELRRSGSEPCVWRRNIPHSHYEIIERLSAPGYFIQHQPTGGSLGVVLDAAQVTQFRSAMSALYRQAVRNLDDIIGGIKTSIPLEVTLARFRLIRNNIRDVIRIRIAQDHATIRAMPGGAQLHPNFNTAFDSIEIPGSDPHKGGQVVAFINYHTVTGGRHRVVYKPGDLSMDKVLFNDANSVAATLGNGVEAYRVETMPADALALAHANLAHYGYMEFVSTGAPQTAGDIAQVYYSLGSNLAVAYVFGLRDIHGENFVLKNNAVQFIDMEATTNTYSGFTAMELVGSAKPLPAELAARIGKGLRAMTAAQVAALVPPGAVLIQQARQGFRDRLRAVHRSAARGAAITGLVRQATHTETRFVPIPTDKLQYLAGAFHGRLVPGTAAVNAEFKRFTRNIAVEVAGNVGGGPALVAELKYLMRTNAARAALNAGDVPFWTRRGRTIYGETGIRDIRRSFNPRLNQSNANEAAANVRRMAGNRANAQADFESQVVPMLQDPNAMIVAAHAAL